MKMSITCLFNIFQGPSESPRHYPACLNEATIKVITPNQEIFVGAFQRWFKTRHTLALVKVVAGAECYIKGKERNTEKKSLDANERVTSVESSHS